MSYCCPNCFNDEGLRGLIISIGEINGESCSYCSASEQPLAEVTALCENFVRVIDNCFVEYSQLSQTKHQDPLEGQYLHELLQEDFDVFSETVRSPEDLLKDILSIHREDRNPIYDLESFWFRREDDWLHHSLNDYLRELSSSVVTHGHALSFETGISSVQVSSDVKNAYEVIVSVLSQATENILRNTILYRARRGRWNSESDLSAPPAYKAKAGRANLQGQPMLYVADDIETAISEVRPSIAETISVAQFELTKTAKMCSLVPHFIESSPFTQFDRYIEEADRVDVRKTLGRLFSKPIRPSDEPREYIITQFLSNEIRKNGFDGIIYLSSQSRFSTSYSGPRNYLFFNPEIAVQHGKIEHFNINSIKYDFTQDRLLI